MDYIIASWSKKTVKLISQDSGLFGSKRDLLILKDQNHFF